MPDARPDRPRSRPKNLETQYEDLKPRRPPRSATEPDGASGSVKRAPTATDPDSGEARRPPEPKTKAPPGWP